MNLRGYGEDRLVAALLRGFPPGDLAIGPGDDCAAAPLDRKRLLLLKTDAVVEGIHFRADAPAGKIGWKAVARAASDFAAMAGVPTHFLVTLAAPDSCPVARVRGIYGGIRRACDRLGLVLAGGESVRTPGPLLLSVAMTGWVERGRAITRAGGQPGDLLFVTGVLGGSLRGRHWCPEPRLREARWLATNARPSAMMDLSDGLAKDLPRLARASGVGFALDAGALPVRVGCSPRQALGDGEDYELLFALPPSRAKTLERAWPQAFPELRLTRIGRLVAGRPQALAGGWDHFAPDPPAAVRRRNR